MEGDKPKKPSWWNNLKGHDHAVQIDQRALVDKILARYAAKFSVFRELLQNSDDAEARGAQIHFYTEGHLAEAEANGSGAAHPDAAINERGSLPDLTRELIGKYEFRNNGKVFREEDWARLKKIADGNPDVEKIGAFGIGFYSVFSVTDKPLVGSGEKWMGFYWRGDQLVARRGNVKGSKEQQPSPWTIFDLPLREAIPMPNLFELTRFLTSSLLFMKFLNKIEMFVDGVLLARIEKTVGNEVEHEIPETFRCSSSLPVSTGTTIVKVVSVKKVKIKSRIKGAVYQGIVDGDAYDEEIENVEDEGFLSFWKKSFFASIINTLASTSVVSTITNVIANYSMPAPDAILEGEVDVEIWSAKANVNLSDHISRELERCTKKPPPKEVKVDILYMGYQPYQTCSPAALPKKRSIFEHVRPDMRAGRAKIFIGHTTSQTTGIAGNMSGRFIPTAEREAIDFVEPNVSVWNKELLFVGGWLCRFVYQHSMETLKARIVSIPTEAEVEEGFHIMRFFSFFKTTPSMFIQTSLEEAFFLASNPVEQPFPIISPKGVVNAKEARIAFAALEKLVRDVPLIEYTSWTGSQAIALAFKLTSRQALTVLKWADVTAELSTKTLTETELIDLLRVIFNGMRAKRFVVDSNMKNELKTMVKYIPKNAPSSPTGEPIVIKLSDIKNYVDIRTGFWLHPDSQTYSLPDTTLSMSVTRELVAYRIVDIFPWQMLALSDWLTHVMAKHMKDKDGVVDPKVALSLLYIVAMAWRGMQYSGEKEKVANLFRTTDIIPTTVGLRKPAEVYYTTLHDVPEIPVIAFAGAHNRTMKRFLHYLGVKDYLTVQIILDRVVTPGIWTAQQLVSYLAGMRRQLLPSDKSALAASAIFEAEPTPDGSDNEGKKYMPPQLFEPNNALRELGFPILKWNGRWWRRSSEAKLLISCDIRLQPYHSELFAVITNKESPETRKMAAFQYLVKNWGTFKFGYSAVSYGTTAFVPCSGPNGIEYAPPNEIVTNPRWKSRGFKAVLDDYRSFCNRQLGIPADPNWLRILEKFKQDPLFSIEVADDWFRFLQSVYKGEYIVGNPAVTLGTHAFIPWYADEERTTIKYFKPSECYIADPSNPSWTTRLFTFIEYSEKAGEFLVQCGVKKTPSPDDMIDLLVKDPHMFILRAGGNDRFFEEIRALVGSPYSISAATYSKMQGKQCLVGQRRTIALQGGDGSEEVWDYGYELAKPNDIIIIDDVAAYILFADSLLAAPRDDGYLNEFYVKAGAVQLSSLVTNDTRTSKTFKDKPHTDRLRSLVLTRLELFFRQRGAHDAKVDFAWLLLKGHFKVKGAKLIERDYTLTRGTTRAKRSLDLSATATRESATGPLILWVTYKVDTYDVAESLLQLMLLAPSNSDILVLSTLLAASDDALFRRGYKVKPLDFHSKLPQDEKKKPPKPSASRAEGSSSRNPKATAAAAPAEEALPGFPGPAAPPPSYESLEPKLKPLRRMFSRLKGLVGESSSSKQPEAGPSSAPQASTTWKYYDDSDKSHAEKMKAIYEAESESEDEADEKPPIVEPAVEAPNASSDSLSYVDPPVESVDPPEFDSDDEEEVLPPIRPTSEFAGDLSGKIRQALNACQSYGTTEPIYLEKDAVPVIRFAKEASTAMTLGALPTDADSLKQIGQVDGIYVFLDMTIDGIANRQRGWLFVQHAYRLHGFSAVINKVVDALEISKASVGIVYTEHVNATFLHNDMLLLNFKHWLGRVGEAWTDWPTKEEYVYWFNLLAREIQRKTLAQHPLSSLGPIADQQPQDWKDETGKGGLRFLVVHQRYAIKLSRLISEIPTPPRWNLAN